MTRDEEIKKKAIEIAMPCNNGQCKAFVDNPCISTPCYANERYEAAIEIAEWADQHPRKGLWDAQKVVEWLENHVIDYKHYDSDCQDGNIDVDDLVEDLIKAMED